MDITQHLRKPSNWQDFEKLCLRLWKEEWNSDDLKINGRLGQEQQGVDICGHRDERLGYCGIQCKCKQEGEFLSRKEIEIEIEKAKRFNPPLVKLVIATTAEKDVRIEEFVRKKDEKLREEGLFSLDIKSWGDIVCMLESHPNVMNWYLGISTDDYAVMVSFPGDKNVLESDAHYLRVPNSKVYYDWLESLRKEYAYSPMSYLSDEKRLLEKNFSFIKVPIILKNLGGSPIDDYKLKFRFNQDVVVSTRVSRHYSTKSLVMDSDFMINLSIEDGIVEYGSRFSLVPGDIDIIPDFYIKSPLGTNDVVLTWELFSRNYYASGQLNVHIKETIETIALKSCSIPIDQWEIVDWIHIEKS